jgi:ribosomal protein L37AE/L43A
MVIYLCKKCNKKFTDKTKYINHINRKYVCNRNEIVNKIENNISENLLNSAEKFLNSPEFSENLQNFTEITEFAGNKKLQKNIKYNCEFCNKTL